MEKPVLYLNTEKMIETLKSRSKNVKNFLLYAFTDSQERQFINIAQAVTNKHLSYLGVNALYELAQVAAANEKLNLEGAVVETGCALGGSSIVIAYAKNKKRKFFIYDTFGMIPAPSEQDGEDVHERYKVIQSGEASGLGNEKYYGYVENLYNKVINNLNLFGFDILENNINLVKGLYENSLKIDFPVALAHIDCDWFDSVLLSLQKIEPYLVSGGTLVIDDYYTYSGCRKAVDEYFKDKKNDFKFVKRSRLHIIKNVHTK